MRQIKQLKFLSAVALSICVSPYSVRAEENSCDTAITLLSDKFAAQGVSNAISIEFSEKREIFRKQDLEAAYCRQVVGNLNDKLAAQTKGIQFSAMDVVEHTIAFESFRLSSYLSSGVAPKLYFGFLMSRVILPNMRRS